MRWMKWAGVGAAMLLVVSCFLTWMVVTSKNLVVSGVEASGTSFGKPGYLHFFFVAFFLAFSFIPRVWAKRFNLVVTAMNLAWAIRNYFIITACRAGECPEKQAGIYLLLVAAVVMLVSSLFPDLDLPAGDPDDARGNKKL